MRIEFEGPEALEEYGQVPIGFAVRSRIRVESLEGDPERWVEEPLPPRWRDYDLVASERPEALRERFSDGDWAVISAFEGKRRLGGAIVARDPAGFAFLQGLADVAIIADLRVAPEARGSGVGRALFGEAVRWARGRGCASLFVETQDTNVAACRFYAAMGCRVVQVDQTAYGPELEEAQVIWGLSLD